MRFKTFSEALPEIMLAATYMLEWWEGCDAEKAADPIQFQMARSNAKARLEQAQKMYEEDASRLNEPLYDALSRLGIFLFTAVHYGGPLVTQETFAKLLEYHYLLGGEVVRTLR